MNNILARMDFRGPMLVMWLIVVGIAGYYMIEKYHATMDFRRPYLIKDNQECLRKGGSEADCRAYAQNLKQF